MFSTKYPYTLTTSTYETDNIHIQLNNASSLWTLLFTENGIWVSSGTSLVFTFKNKKITPAVLDFKINSWNTGSTSVPSSNLYIDYYINNEWVNKVAYPIELFASPEVNIELPSEQVESLRVRFTASGTLIQCNVLFNTTSQMIKNSIKNVVMQNELLQKYVAIAEKE